ncbi:MAG: PAS domain S-box protein [Candidatus Lokiarchaeota archaeon]
MNNISIKQNDTVESVFKTIYKKSPIGMGLFSSNGKLIDLNKVCIKLFGLLDKKEIKGFELFNYQNVPDQYLNKLKKGEIVKFERLIDFDLVKEKKLYKTNNSGKIWIDILFTPLFLGKKEALNYYLAQIQNISERKRIELKLSESESRLRHLVFSNPTIIYTSKISGDYGITFISENISERWGYEPNIFVENSDFWITHIHPDDVDYVLSTLSKLYKEEFLKFDYRLKLNDESYRWMRNEVQLIKDDTGSPVEAIGSIIDINEIKAIDEELKGFEEKFRIITEQSLMGICIAQNNKMQYINQTYAKIFGYSIEEMMNWDLNDVYNAIYPEDRKFALNQLAKKQDGDKSIIANYKYRGIKKSGEIIWIDNFSKPIMFKGRPADFVIIMDITKRKKVEQKIKESEEKYHEISNQYKMLLDSITDGVYALNRDWEFILVNKGAGELINMSIKDLLGHKIYEVFPDIKNTSFFKAYERVISKGKAERITDSFFIPSGQMRYYEINIYPIVEGILCIAKDVTEEKKIEERFKYLVSSNPAIIYTSKVSDDYAATFISENVKELMGYTPKDFIDNPNFWLDHIHPEDKERVLSQLSELYKKGYHTHEYRFKFEDGEYYWMRDELKLIYDEKGNPLEIIGFWIDITDRVITEQKLVESEEKFRTIAEQSLLGLSIIQEGSFIFVNQAFSNIIGYPIDEIQRWSNQDTLNVIQKEDLAYVRKKLDSRKRDDLQSMLQYQCRIKTKLGRIKWIEVISKYIIYKGNLATILSLIDISKAKRAENELKELNKLKSELISRTSHELKTPLVSIKGYTNLLLNQHNKVLDPYTISILYEIKQGCDRLESLIKDLLETSKLESKEIKLGKSEEDLTFLIRFILDIQDKMITMMEKERIYEVIMNLLSNAIKYTPSNGKILISSEKEEKNYIISIKDNGIGLTSAEKEKIFKKFGKIERYGKGLDIVSEGSGLGLYISKKIIELHGGKIWVESKGRNEGSIFYFSLPIEIKPD